MSESKETQKAVPLPSAALTPELLSYINTTTQATIRELMASMLPMMASMALTPEKILEMEKLRRAPTDEQQAAAAREKRERLMQRQEIEENAANKRNIQDHCPHKYPTGQLSVSACRNFPDRQARFLCHLCACWFTPREWRIAPPDPQNPRGKPYVAEPHKQYAEIAALMASRLQE